MNELTVILTVISGFLLRFGIPIGMTALLVYALRRLDQKWQREVELAHQSGLGRVSRYDRIRCWATKKCSHENRESCPAFLESGRPCWQVYREISGELRHECLDCPMFQRVPTPRSV